MTKIKNVVRIEALLKYIKAKYPVGCQVCVFTQIVVNDKSYEVGFSGTVISCNGYFIAIKNDWSGTVSCIDKFDLLKSGKVILAHEAICNQAAI